MALSDATWPGVKARFWPIVSTHTATWRVLVTATGTTAGLTTGTPSSPGSPGSSGANAASGASASACSALAYDAGAAAKAPGRGTP